MLLDLLWVECERKVGLRLSRWLVWLYQILGRAAVLRLQAPGSTGTAFDAFLWKTFLDNIFTNLAEILETFFFEERVKEVGRKTTR